MLVVGVLGMLVAVVVCSVVGLAVGGGARTVSVACMRRIRRAICPCVGRVGSVWRGVVGVRRLVAREEVIERVLLQVFVRSGRVSSTVRLGRTVLVLVARGGVGCPIRLVSGRVGIGRVGVAIGRVAGTVSVACMRRIRRAICPCVGCMGSVCPYCGITGVLRQTSIVCLARFIDDVILPREVSRVASSRPCSPADSVAVDLSGGHVCLIHCSVRGVSFVGAADAMTCVWRISWRIWIEGGHVSAVEATVVGVGGLRAEYVGQFLG